MGRAWDRINSEDARIEREFRMLKVAMSVVLAFCLVSLCLALWVLIKMAVL